jgi:hypothetical protein
MNVMFYNMAVLYIAQVDRVTCIRYCKILYVPAEYHQTKSMLCNTTVLYFRQTSSGVFTGEAHRFERYEVT